MSTSSQYSCSSSSENTNSSLGSPSSRDSSVRSSDSASVGSLFGVSGDHLASRVLLLTESFLGLLVLYTGKPVKSKGEKLTPAALAKEIDLDLNELGVPLGVWSVALKMFSFTGEKLRIAVLRGEKFKLEALNDTDFAVNAE